MKQVADIPLFGIGSNRGRHVDAKAPVKPTRAPDLASASPPSGLALAIIGVGWNQSSCVLKDLTLQTERTEFQRCGPTWLLSSVVLQHQTYQL